MCDTFTCISMNHFYQYYCPDIWGASVGACFCADSSSGCCGQYWYSSGRCAPRVQVKLWYFTTHGNWPLSTTLVLCKEKPPVTPHKGSVQWGFYFVVSFNKTIFYVDFLVTRALNWCWCSQCISKIGTGRGIPVDVQCLHIPFFCLCHWY